MNDIEKFKSTDVRLGKLYYIVNKDGKKTLLKPNNIQKRINASKANRKIILKSRQVGVSTNELIKIFDRTIWTPNTTSCIIAHERDGIEKLFRICRRAHDFMDPNIQPILDRGGGSKYEMFFPEINSRIYVDLESRGDTIHNLHISEMAFIKELNRAKSTIESVPLNGRVTVESTPNGLNHFYEMWMDRDSNYEKLFYPWFFHDEYVITNHGLDKKDLTDDEIELIKKVSAVYKMDLTLEQIAFRRFKQRELKAMFKQEYPEDDVSCFLTSGNSPFDLQKIKTLYDNAKEPIKVVNGIRVFEEFDPSEIYVIGADPAEGVNNDSSAAHVFKVSNREQVAAFDSKHLKPSEFADKLIEIADMFSDGYPPVLLAVERNNHGHAVLLKLDEIHQYPNLFRIKREDRKSDYEEMRLGWLTDRVTRPLMIDTLIDGIENGTVILHDKATLSECLTLKNNEGKIQAEEGKHDDLFIAAAISTQMCIEEGKLSVYDGLTNKIKI